MGDGLTRCYFCGQAMATSSGHRCPENGPNLPKIEPWRCNALSVLEESRAALVKELRELEAWLRYHQGPKHPERADCVLKAIAALSRPEGAEERWQAELCEARDIIEDYVLHSDHALTPAAREARHRVAVAWLKQNPAPPAVPAEETPKSVGGGSGSAGTGDRRDLRRSMLR